MSEVERLKALLREARKTVGEWLEMGVPIDLDVFDRIDAVLAAPEVEWEPNGSPGHLYTQSEGGALRMQVFPLVTHDWKWRCFFAGHCFARGVAQTQDEAKAAAINAAKERSA
jgi:hypothetical protein